MMRLISKILKNKQIVVGGSVILAFIIMAALAPLIAPYPCWKQDYTVTLTAPCRGHYFGTDEFGRDTFSRVIYGARASLLSALGAAGLAGIVGIVLGLIAGYFGGFLERIIQGLVDVTWSFPSLLLALVLVVIMKPGLTTTMIAIALGYWPQYTQVLRSDVLNLREEEFVLAAHSIGAGSMRIIVKHILPNVIAPVTVLISLTMGYAIIIEATLSFLGLGVQPPMSSWGTMLSDARDFLSRAPWLSVFPGMAITMAVLGFNLLGDGLRDLLDPRLRRIR
jgi:peptide/nickel transport system permease protein